MSHQCEKSDVYNIVYYLIQDRKMDPGLLFTLLDFFWPTFIEKDGYVFLENTFDEQAYMMTIDLKSNPELWINLLTFEGYFSELPYWEEMSIFFAQALIPIWQAKLQRDFPERRFTVRHLCDKEVGGYGLTFFQTKDCTH